MHIPRTPGRSEGADRALPDLARDVAQLGTPMSGTVMYLPADRVRPLDIPMVKAVSIVKHIGVGSGAALHGVDLTLPACA